MVVWVIVQIENNTSTHPSVQVRITLFSSKPSWSSSSLQISRWIMLSQISVSVSLWSFTADHSSSRRRPSLLKGNSPDRMMYEEKTNDIKKEKCSLWSHREETQRHQLYVRGDVNVRGLQRCKPVNVITLFFFFTHHCASVNTSAAP